VLAILPDGQQVMLGCDAGSRHCGYLSPGRYEAEIDGDSLSVFVPDVSGKEHKVKYMAVMVGNASAAAQQKSGLAAAMLIPPDSAAPPQAPSIETSTEQAGAVSTAPATSAPVPTNGNPSLSAQDITAITNAAANGDANAQIILGLAYELGQGVPQDYVQAVAWWRKAADQGNADAQHYLGAAYVTGQGVPEDDAQAVVWWRKAAEGGNAEAQDNLALLYMYGNGVPQDYAQAAAWYRKAAEQGNADGQMNVAAMYGSGKGVPNDFVEAYFWADVAVPSLTGKARDLAVKELSLAASFLTPADLTAVQERARKWFEDHPAKP
jgi:TPR repeat protein